MENTLRSFAASLGISVVSALLVTASAHAQSHVTFLIGPMADYNFVMYRTDAFPALNSEPTVFLVQNGTGRGYFAGVSAEDPLSANMHHSFIFEVGYDTKPGTLSTQGNDAFHDIHDTAVTISSVSLSAILSYVDLNVGYKYNLRADSIPNGLGIQLCLSIGVKYKSDFWKSVWSWNQQQPAISSSAIPSANAIRLALRPELTYDLPLNHAWVLTPFAGYEVPLTKVDPTENWWASAFYGGLALRYAIW